MTFLTTFFEKIIPIKSRLTRLGDKEPLNLLSYTVIFALDIVILTILFMGLSDHANQLVSPEEYIPAVCREIIIEKEWTPVARLDYLENYAFSEFGHEYGSERTQTKTQTKTVIHPDCQAISSALDTVKKDESLEELFEKRRILKQEEQQIRRYLGEIEGAHEMMLHREKANIKSEKLQAIFSEVDQKIETLDTVIAAHQLTDNDIQTTPTIQNFWALIDSDSKGHKATLIADLKKLDFWHPIKVIGFKLVFLFPLLLLLCFWNSRSLTRNRELQVLMSSHMLLVASVPTLVCLLELILEIIPQKFIKNILAILERFHLIAIWHYLLIAAAIAVALFLIYVIQKKIFDPQKMREERLAKGQCCDCGRKLPDHACDYCVFCGASQKKPCKLCQKNTCKGGPFCKHCGGGCS